MPTANRAIELHDSFLAVLEVAGGAVRLVFEPGYVHETQGTPGIDPGVGWLQTIEFVVEAGSIEGRLSALPFDVSDGKLTVNDREYQNLIPLPLNTNGDVELSLLLGSGEHVAIRGKAIRSGFEGLAEDPEEFPGV
jgi:hypothetical protein